MSTAPGCYWKSEWKVGEFVLCLESGHLPWSGVVICVQLFTRPFNMVPRHLTASCQPVSFAPGRQHLPSTDHGRLELPRVRLATCGYILLCSCAGLSSRILTFRRSHSQSLSLPTFKRHLIPLAHIQHVGSSHEVYTRYVSLLLCSSWPVLWPRWCTVRFGTVFTAGRVQMITSWFLPRVSTAPLCRQRRCK